MDISLNTKNKDKTTRITNALLLNSSFIDNLGLMHGKMGISILFYQLARETNNHLYEDFAGELIDEIYEDISFYTPSDFENGLAGIGYGIEYLVQNGFIEADTNEVLQEFDDRIFKQLLYDINHDFGIKSGLLSAGFYFLKRIQNPNADNNNIQSLTNKQILIHFVDEIEKLLTCDIIINLLNLTNTASSKQNTDNNIKNADANKFDITWDYTLLIWFLAEFHTANLYNHKAEKIINRLIKPLLVDSNWPKQKTKELQIRLAIAKLGSCAIKEEKMSTQLNKIETIIQRKQISRKDLANEQSPESFSLANGSAGISWLYDKLFTLTNKETYKQETQYWLGLDYDKHSAPDFGFEDILNKEGVFSGLAGSLLVNSMSVNSKK